ncbi:hypothetical protein [Neisseria musculi]|uniref:Uncharacterized protein n=1 Tax=Neisseria musculi TaxID=1815583 RepID=A0A7H1MCW6_9NEIS|nr:hypothetical protein [Neisseria musculi]QNT59481.1 hypothetical protein H7A79_0753 [Neisseria musculi]
MSEYTTYALFGKPSGEKYEAFLTDTVGLTDGTTAVIDSLELAQQIKTSAEQDGFTDVRILAVGKGDKPDFTAAVR